MSVSPAVPPRPVGIVLPSLSLWKREMVRFFRQPNRVASALVSPVVIWLLLGMGLGGSFTLSVGDSEPVDYLAYLLPGIVTMILLFTAIFSTITVIEDRREGFLQSVLASPAPRLSIVLGKLLGGASIATIHGLVLLVLWPLVAPWPGAAAMTMALGVMIMLAFSMTALGFCIAWPMDSTAGFHAVMMVFLMPMWLLSGALFPVTGATVALQALMWIKPMTYGHAALSGVLMGDAATGPALLVSPALAMIISAGIALLLVGIAVALVARPGRTGR